MLTDTRLKAAKPGPASYKLTDSGQLFLHVTPAGGRHWRMNYTFGRNANGRPTQKTLSFGPYPAVSLQEARRKRDDAKALLREGKDPAVARRLMAETLVNAHANNFEVVARRWHSLRKPTWSPVHASDVLRSLERDVFPGIGSLPLSMIEPPTLLDLLRCIEDRGAIETAHRARQRISEIFVFAIASGLAKYDPAGSLGPALRQKPVARKQPSIIDEHTGHERQLRALRQVVIDCEAERCRIQTKIALRLLALTAVRPNELQDARWSELEDLDGERPLWRIPALRMKGDQQRKSERGGEHLVPLSTHAVALIKLLRPITGGYKLMFPSERHVHQPISENTLRALLIRAGYHKRHVPHGFRAAFSTIMHERATELGQANDGPVIELMLAHVPPNKVASAYNRAAFAGRRRAIAQEWSDLLVGDMWPLDVHIGEPIRYAATGKGRALASGRD